MPGAYRRVFQRSALAALFVCTIAAAADAQPVVDPNFVEFNASPDHSAVASDGTPILQRYTMSVYVAGSSTQVATADLGKPAPGSGGVIRVTFLDKLSTALTPGVTYEARVNAVGPGGSTSSASSNTFILQAPCAPTISPTSRSVSASATSGTVSVSAGAGCTWSSKSNVNWITISNGSGTANGTVSYSITANTSTSSRTGTATIAGQTFTVTQAGVTCSYSISPTSQALPYNAGVGLVDVATGSSCSWSARSNAGWISVSAGASVTGSGTVTYAVTANPDGISRTGTMTIAGQTFSVTQAAAPCSYTLTPTGRSMSSAAGSSSFTVNVPSGCNWSATSNTGWITVSNGTGRSGSGTVNFSVTANPNGTSRSGTVAVGNQTFTVTQAAATCSYTLTPTSRSMSSAAGSSSFTVNAPTGCNWSATSNDGWITVSNGTGRSGTGTVNFSVTANPNATSRAGSITAGGETFTVIQSATSCSYTLTPTGRSMSSAAGSSSFAVSAPTGCNWSATSNAGWITVSNGTGRSGDGTVNFSVTANPNGTSRAGTISVGGASFTVTQAAASCSYTLTPTGRSMSSAAGSSSFAVSAPTGCNWSATSNAGWITVSNGTGRSGDGTVNFSVTANPNGTSRAGTISVGGASFTVTQAAASCSYTLTPPSRSMSSAAGSSSFTVNAPGGCNWSATSNNGWITVSNGTGRSGTGTVNFSVTANPNASLRTGTVTAAGQTFTVTQAGTSCTYTLSRTTATIGHTGGNRLVSVTTADSCLWTATSNVSWLTVGQTDGGTGSGVVAVNAALNPSNSERTGTVTIAGETFTLTQFGTPCSYTLSPTSKSMPPAGGDESFSVTTTSACSWSASITSTWVTTNSAGTGSGTVTFTVAPNGTGRTRSATIQVGNERFTISQAGATTPQAPKGLRIANGGK